MGKKSELIITKGQEFKIVVKDSIRDDDVFIEQYEQAAGMLNTIVAESIVAAEKSDKTFNTLYSLNEYENNIIAFCGERGEGKSSAMLTFINSLYTNLPKTLQGEDKFYEKYQELYKVHFSEPIIIDPSQFDDVHNILDIILAKIYRNFSRRYEENNRCVDEFDINRLQNQFQKVYREVSMINNQSKMLDDEFDYEGNIGKLSKLGESTDLKEDLQELIKQYLEFVKKCSNRENGKERLIIAIDDLDLCNSNACNGVQREHNKKLNNGLPILHKVPPKRDYGRYFCIMAEKGGTSHGGLTEKLSLFFHAKKQEVNAYGR